MIYESLQEAIQLVNDSDYAYCHYITPNDVGATGGHQCGFYFSRECYKMFFDQPGTKGTNIKKDIEINWQKSFVTQSTVNYYGKRTRNEYRLTRFGRHFEFLEENYIGCLQIMTRNSDGEYNAYILTDQDNIETFVATFYLDVTKSTQIIKSHDLNVFDKAAVRKIQIAFASFVEEHVDFPSTKEIAEYVRRTILKVSRLQKKSIADNSDSLILEWVNREYELFKLLEEKIYRETYTCPFKDCTSLIDFANKILNRRKSRAGSSLENHLSAIFKSADLHFSHPGKTEGKKKPDFLFPGKKYYLDSKFNADNLIMLAAKTTCKDRWRQVLNEADRIPQKHLFTLQCGVTKFQLEEMANANLTLVVPRDNLSLFPQTEFNNIISLSNFISIVKSKQDYLS